MPFFFNLPEISSSFYLKSSHYVPVRLRDEIDEKTIWLMENGLYHFFNTFTEFLMNMRSQKVLQHDEDILDIDDGDIPAITFQQLKRPFLLFFSCLGVALIVFIIEVIVSKIKRRLQQR